MRPVSEQDELLEGFQGLHIRTRIFSKGSIKARLQRFENPWTSIRIVELELFSSSPRGLDHANWWRRESTSFFNNIQDYHLHSIDTYQKAATLPCCPHVKPDRRTRKNLCQDTKIYGHSIQNDLTLFFPSCTLPEIAKCLLHNSRLHYQASATRRFLLIPVVLCMAITSDPPYYSGGLLPPLTEAVNSQRAWKIRTRRNMTQENLTRFWVFAIAFLP